MRHRLSQLSLGFLILLVAGFYLPSLGPEHGWGDDFAMYILHARNIVEGAAYDDTGYVYNPAYSALGPRAYPPVFPLLLAPVYWAFGPNLWAMKVEIVLLFLLALIAIYLAFRRDLPDGYLLPALGIIALHPYLFGCRDDVRPDLPMLLFLHLFVYLARRAYDEQPGPGPAPAARHILPLGALLYLCYGTRSAALALVPALFLYDVIRHRSWRPGLFPLAVTGVAAALALLQSLWLHADASYLDQLAAVQDWPRLITANAFGCVEALWNYWVTRPWPGVGIALFAGFSALAVAGLIQRLRRGPTILECFLGFYVLSIIVWPAFAGRRFLIPVFPIYVYLAFLGLHELSARLRGGAAQKAAVAVLAPVLVSYGGSYLVERRSPPTEGVTHPQSVELFRYIREATPEDAVIVFRKPRALALYTGRRASVYHQPDDDQELWDYFQGIGAGYIVVSRAFDDDESYLQPFVDRHSDALERTFSNAGFDVYRIRGAAQAPCRLEGGSPKRTMPTRKPIWL